MGCVSFSPEECFRVRVWLCHSRNASPAGSCLLSTSCYVCVALHSGGLLLLLWLRLLLLPARPFKCSTFEKCVMSPQIVITCDAFTWDPLFPTRWATLHHYAVCAQHQKAERPATATCDSWSVLWKVCCCWDPTGRTETRGRDTPSNVSQKQRD